ncbi:hypothetical protein KAR91_17570 [Candidatus Pacearchaeota archaeon]|nr:hypothetical protein [Candidatus Pacearchaeota archaeon]
MSSSSRVYDAVSRILPTDDINIGVAIVRYSVEDSEVDNHPENYVGLTQREIERRLGHQGLNVPHKRLHGILDNLSTHKLLNSRGKRHYIAASRFT